MFLLNIIPISKKKVYNVSKTNVDGFKEYAGTFIKVIKKKGWVYESHLHFENIKI